MATITIHRNDVTGEEVAETLRSALGSGYEVTPGMRLPLVPLGSPRPDRPEFVLVSSSRLNSAQVKIVRHSGRSDLRVSRGGLFVNTSGTGRKVLEALRRGL